MIHESYFLNDFFCSTNGTKTTFSRTKIRTNASKYHHSHTVSKPYPFVFQRVLIMMMTLTMRFSVIAFAGSHAPPEGNCAPHLGCVPWRNRWLCPSLRVLFLRFYLMLAKNRIALMFYVNFINLLTMTHDKIHWDTLWSCLTVLSHFA